MERGADDTDARALRARERNLLGRIGYVGSHGRARGRAATAVSITSVFPIAALIRIIAFLPETKGRELEETAAH